MIILPKIYGNISITAHPDGCRRMVDEQIAYVKSKKDFPGPKNVLVIGASTGYGLASRVTLTFGAHAKTIGVFLEKAPDNKHSASAGWYNSAAFENAAHHNGYYAKSINGDAFSPIVKSQVAELISKDLGKIDLIVYSLASPRRTHPQSGKVFSSVLKPIGDAFTSKTLNIMRGEVKQITIDPATKDEIDQTVAVMGGEDWELWIDFLSQRNLLADGLISVAYSYLGPSLTHPIYKNGTIGKAKEDLKMTADNLNRKFSSIHLQAIISINKLIVTQASIAIPVIPLYYSLLSKVMKEKKIDENSIEQIHRLYSKYIYASNPPSIDPEGNIRLDDFELREDVQKAILELWPTITTENLMQLTDAEGYRNEFYQLFGFNCNGINYNLDTEPLIKIPSLDNN